MRSKRKWLALSATILLGFLAVSASAHDPYRPRPIPPYPMRPYYPYRPIPYCPRIVIPLPLPRPWPYPVEPWPVYPRHSEVLR